LNGRVCAYDFAIKALEYVNCFGIIGYGKVCSFASAHNFVPAPRQNYEVENKVKFDFYFALQA